MSIPVLLIFFFFFFFVSLLIQNKFRNQISIVRYLGYLRNSEHIKLTLITLVWFFQQKIGMSSLREIGVEGAKEFFSLNINCSVELIYCKNHFNLSKILVLRLFKMVANQMECFRLEQRSIMKFLVTENCKPCEIYKWICLWRSMLWGDAYKWAKHGSATFSLSWKDNPWSRNTMTLK